MKITDRNHNEISIEEIATKLENGQYGMLTFEKGYKIGGAHCSAFGLTLFPRETKIFVRNDKLIVTAYFREFMLPLQLRSGNDDRLVLVECELDPAKDFIQVGFVE